MSLMALARRVMRPETRTIITQFHPWATGFSFEIEGPAFDTSVTGALQCGQGAYESHVCRILDRLVTEDAVVADVGANIGVLTLLCAAKAKNGKVYAFEATQRSYQLLKKNIKRNQIANVKPLHYALTDRSGGKVRFNMNESFLGGAFWSSTGVKDGLGESVRTLTLDRWAEKMNLPRLDLIKMDIEGSEPNALAGASQVLSKFRPALLIECNAIALNRFHQRSFEELYQILREQYACIYLIPDDPQLGLCQLDSMDQLRQSLCQGRGSDDLLCLHQPTDLPTMAFTDYMGQLRQQNHGRQVIIEPRFTISLREPQPITLNTNESRKLDVHLENLGQQTWPHENPNIVNLCYHWLDNQGQMHVFDGMRTSLPQDLEQHQALNISMDLKAPEIPGEYQLVITLVQEGMLWLEQIYPKGVLRCHVVVHAVTTQ